jgi:hypothetical protein
MIGSGKLSIGKKLLEVYHDFWTGNNQQLSNSSFLCFLEEQLFSKQQKPMPGRTLAS